MLGKMTPKCIEMPRWKFLVGLLCVALVVCSGCIAATHTHDRGEALRTDCGLCLTAHTAVQLPNLPPTTMPVHLLTQVAPERPIRRARLQLAVDLFTRPPPVYGPLA
jgi:hypothetical protein